MFTTKNVRSRNRARNGLTSAVAVAVAFALSACGAEGAAPAEGDAGALKVGFANMTTGAISFPRVLEGAKVAQQYVNEELGGVNGHPLELDFCDLGNTAQETQACGQKFAADPEIPFALTTVNVFGNSGFSAPMSAQGKAVLGGTGITPADLSDKDVYWIFSGTPAVYGAWGQLVKAVNDAEGIDHLSYIGQEGSQASANGFKVVSAEMGPGIETVNVSAKADSADYIATIRAAKITNESMVMIDVPSTAACSGIAKGLDSLGIKPKFVATSSVCVNPELIASEPKIFEGWSLSTNQENPYPGTAKTSKDVATFTDAWDKYGGEGDIAAGDTQTGWALVLTMQRILENAGTTEVTSDAFKNAVMDYHGEVVMGGGGKLECPGAEPNTAMCNSSVVFYTVADGAIQLDDPISNLQQ